MRIGPLPTLTLAFTTAVHAQQTLPLWPHATPEPPQAAASGPDFNVNPQHEVHYTSVTVPTLTVYPPHDHNSGTAALVFPGGGYYNLAWTHEGTETCEWLNSIGVTCLLVKYRVPQPPGEAGHYPADFADLEDAQQAMRMARAHAAQWHIDPSHIGVVGFSAGGNLAALLSTHPDDHHVETTPAAPDVDASIDARANFAILIYPAYLALAPEQTALNPVYAPNAFTPPTFITAAEDDKRYGKNSPVYYRALLDANVPAELHMFASGGHGFGIHPTGTPGQWTLLAAGWLRSLGMIPTPPPPRPASISTGAPAVPPCSSAIPPPPQPGNPEKPGTAPDLPPCF